MGLFKDDPPKAKNASASTSGTMPTVIAAGTVITGDLSGGADVQLDGVLNGNVDCTRLTIGTTGALHGEAKVEELVVLGEVRGEILARKVRLGPTAKVYGDVDHEILEVEAGAEVEGRYSRAVVAKGTSEATKANIPIGAASGAMQREAPPTAPSSRKGTGANGTGDAALASSGAPKGDGAGRVTTH